MILFLQTTAFLKYILTSFYSEMPQRALDLFGLKGVLDALVQEQRLRRIAFILPLEAGGRVEIERIGRIARTRPQERRRHGPGRPPALPPPSGGGQTVTPSQRASGSPAWARPRRWATPTRDRRPPAGRPVRRASASTAFDVADHPSQIAGQVDRGPLSRPARTPPSSPRLHRLEQLVLLVLRRRPARRRLVGAPRARCGSAWCWASAPSGWSSGRRTPWRGGTRVCEPAQDAESMVARRAARAGPVGPGGERVGRLRQRQLCPGPGAALAGAGLGRRLPGRRLRHGGDADVAGRLRQPAGPVAAQRRARRRPRAPSTATATASSWARAARCSCWSRPRRPGGARRARLRRGGRLRRQQRRPQHGHPQPRSRAGHRRHAPGAGRRRRRPGRRRLHQRPRHQHAGRRRGRGARPGGGLRRRACGACRSARPRA